MDTLRRNLKVFIPELSLEATDNHKIVGHILFAKINIKDSNGNQYESLGLAPMAVRPEYQKRGVPKKKASVDQTSID